MEAKEIYLKIKREITKGLYAYDDQIAAIAKWVESEFEPKKQGKKLPIHNVSNNEVALKAFVEEFVEAWEDGMGGDTDLYRKAKSLL
ncbi:MAG: hypothetical protein M0R46_11700 [Candidatus Muirbacterium halophilum]|nr:hypothetical protein [Candidatus Muirbacterium halophilum]